MNEPGTGLPSGIDRRELGIAVLASGVGAAIASSPRAASADAGAGQSVATTPSAQGQTTYFFRNSAFEFVLLSTLGRTYYQGGNIGKVLWVIRQIEDGNYRSAYDTLVAAGEESRGFAEASLAGGHRESARQAYLWAMNFFDSAVYFADGTGDPTLAAITWQRMDDCWLKAIGLFNPAIEQVAIPYEGTTLRGFLFHAADEGAGGRRPLLILNNGSDGSALDMWVMGAAGGTARGYDCLTFDGPGQGHALWRQDLYFRPDWEKVITPVVDFALTLPEVDPGRIALQGISQGGYWVPRAVAFEKRIAAAIADPGVVDVSTSWTAELPPPLIEMLKAGQKQEFDQIMAEAMPPEAKDGLAFRMRPYGTTSYYEAFRAAMAYTLDGVAERITCPMLITAPENEAFWPGQSVRLRDMLTSPATLVPFPASEGADLHCEPKAFGLRDLRVFDWLDSVMKA